MFAKLFTTSFIISVGVLSSLAPTRLMVSRVGPCEEAQTAIVTVTELSITTKTYDSSLSGVLNITEDISNGWQVQAVMQKCLDIRNTDTCDYFKSYNLVKNGCADEEDGDEDFYTMFFHYTNPRLTCPLQAGTYKVVEYPVFTEDNYLAVHESRISTSVFGYTFRLNGYFDSKKIFCVEAYLQLLYIRNHNWIAERDNLKNISNNQASIDTSKEETEY